MSRIKRHSILSNKTRDHHTMCFLNKWKQSQWSQKVFCYRWSANLNINGIPDKKIVSQGYNHVLP